MRGSTVVQAGYSNLRPWENTSDYFINARPHSICEASLYPCGSEAHTAGKFFKKAITRGILKVWETLNSIKD